MEHKYFYFAVFWTLLISYLSLTTINKEPFLVTMPNKDKVVHFLFYFIFVISWTKAFKKTKVKDQLIIVFIAVLYGIIIEIFQSIVTVSREADVYDAVANALGAVVAFGFLRFLLK